MSDYKKKDIPKKGEGLSEWYNKIVLAAELADYGPAKGTMIFRPYGYALWEGVQKEMDAVIKDHGVENAYFPMFIPESLLQKEAEHVEGFAPELAVVTIGGGEELQERLVIRPTSETIMYEAFSRWIHSWRDLPMKLNQWSNVVRWEKRTYMFLRTSEFLWQEGHTAHATHDEALETQKWAMNMYENIYRDLLAIPGYVGYKSDTERFAGADATLTYEALMPEGKALQSATSHDLGQNFSKAFDVAFQDEDGKNKHPWQTSWGLSTRSLGALIMMHGDDAGLRLPPNIAPIQAVILPVREDESLNKYAQDIAETLGDVRVRVDDRTGESLGYKINKWELKGVPLRVEIGPKEMEAKEVTLVRRDNFEKETVGVDEAAKRVGELLDDIQVNLLTQAEEFLGESTHEVDNYNEFKKIMIGDRGFILAAWCENAECEKAIKEDTKATTRCLPIDAAEEDLECIKCGDKAKHKWYFAASY